MDKIIVLKCGGSSVDELSASFFENIQSLRENGIKPVIVHGGGPAIQRMLDQLNMPNEFVDGLRKTSAAMMDVVEMVLTGNVNPTLTRTLNKHGIEAVGIAGSDMNLLQASPLDEAKYGQVGEVSKVNTTVIQQLLEQNIVPVISPIAFNESGKKFNVNADTAAGAVASALQADQLIFVTDVPGILQDGQLIEEIDTIEIEALIANETIYGGMIPKVKAAMKGLSNKVKEVMIVNGKQSQLKTATSLAGTTIKQAVVEK